MKVAIDQSRNQELAGPVNCNSCVGASMFIHYVSGIETDSLWTREVQSVIDTYVRDSSPGLRARFRPPKVVVIALLLLDGVERTSRDSVECHHGQGSQYVE